MWVSWDASLQVFPYLDPALRLLPLVYREQCGCLLWCFRSDDECWSGIPARFGRLQFPPLEKDAQTPARAPVLLQFCCVLQILPRTTVLQKRVPLRLTTEDA